MPKINQVALSGRLSRIPISASLKTVLLVYADGSSSIAPIAIATKNGKKRPPSSISCFGRKPQRPFLSACTKSRRSLLPQADCKATPGAMTKTSRNLQILEKGQEPNDGEEVDTEATPRAA